MREITPQCTGKSKRLWKSLTVVFSVFVFCRAAWHVAGIVQPFLADSIVMNSNASQYHILIERFCVTVLISAVLILVACLVGLLAIGIGAAVSYWWRWVQTGEA